MLFKSILGVLVLFSPLYAWVERGMKKRDPSMLKVDKTKKIVVKKNVSQKKKKKKKKVPIVIQEITTSIKKNKTIDTSVKHIEKEISITMPATKVLEENISTFDTTMIDKMFEEIDTLPKKLKEAQTMSYY